MNSMYIRISTLDSAYTRACGHADAHTKHILTTHTHKYIHALEQTHTDTTHIRRPTWGSNNCIHLPARVSSYQVSTYQPNCKTHVQPAILTFYLIIAVFFANSRTNANTLEQPSKCLHKFLC